MAKFILVKFHAFIITVIIMIIMFTSRRNNTNNIVKKKLTKFDEKSFLVGSKMYQTAAENLQQISQPAITCSKLAIES